MKLENIRLGLIQETAGNKQAVMDSRFLELAKNATTREQHDLFMSQHYRLIVRNKLDSCRACPLGCRGIKPEGFSGKTPAFVSFVTAGPVGYKNFICERLLPAIGYRAEDVCFIPMQSCDPGWAGDSRRLLPTNQVECKENFEWQMNLSSSRVFVLMGTKPAGWIYGTEPDSLKDIRGSWTELASRSGFKQFYFITEEPGPLNQLQILEDFRGLGSLLHYAWAVQMTELFPEAGFQHQFTYETICDIVANDVKRVLLAVDPGKRGEEFMRIMTRVCRDGSGLAVKALWDNVLAGKVGIDTSGPEWWTNPILGDGR